ncbi:L-fuculose-phosphate aldolase protein [Rutstroemia sp. NJR-2017a WRK4]|nr:L-fuculose-phosphate aldolase protein [Rutstroemia sp. NJR-2017a WRK4]
MAPSATPAELYKDEQTSTSTSNTKEKTPLEAISHGGMVMPGIPTFTSHTLHRQHILIHTAAIFRDFARRGFTEGMSGHISVRDPEFPSYIWMNPLGRHFGLMTAGDLICLDVETGRIVGGNRSRPANAAGFQIHSAIHKAREDVHAICHAHTISGRAWSVFGLPLQMLTQDICNFHRAHSVYTSHNGIVFSSSEGVAIAQALGPTNKGVILQNHGLLTVGSTVDEAGFLFGLMDRGCEIQLKAEAAAANGLQKKIIGEQEAEFNFRWASEKHALYREMQPDVEFEMEVAGEGVLERGVEGQRVDHGVGFE